MKQHSSKQVRMVLEILRDEVRGDIRSALRKMTKDYSMTWVDLGIDGKSLFPTTKKPIEKELREAYVIKGRRYQIKNIAEGRNLVMVELVESYPDPKTGKRYRTPLVLVLEMKGGKIRTGRHYLDTRIARKQLPEKTILKAYQGNKKFFMTIIR